MKIKVVRVFSRSFPAAFIPTREEGGQGTKRSEASRDEGKRQETGKRAPPFSGRSGAVLYGAHRPAEALGPTNQMFWAHK